MTQEQPDGRDAQDKVWGRGTVHPILLWMHRSPSISVFTNPEAPLTLSFWVCMEAFSHRCGQFNHQSFLRNSTSGPSPFLGDQEMGKSSNYLITWLVPRQPPLITWLSRSFPKITLLSYTDRRKGIFMNNRRYIFHLYCSNAISETNEKKYYNKRCCYCSVQLENYKCFRNYVPGRDKSLINHNTMMSFAHILIYDPFSETHSPHTLMHLWDLSSPTRDWPWGMAMKTPNPNHWATRELLSSLSFMTELWSL